MGSAGKDSGGDDVLDSFLDDAAHGAGAHFGVITFVNEDLFGFGSDLDGDFLGFEGFVGRSDNEIKNLD